MLMVVYGIVSVIDCCYGEAFPCGIILCLSCAVICDDLQCYL